MKKLPVTLLAAALAATLAHAAPIRPGTPYTLDEIRGYATLERTLDRLGIELARQYHPEEAPVYSFLRDRDISDTALNFDPFASAAPVHFLSLPSTFLTVLLTGTAASCLPKDILAWTSAAMALAAALA